MISAAAVILAVVAGQILVEAEVITVVAGQISVEVEMAGPM